jgi:hypothetical protein
MVDRVSAEASISADLTDVCRWLIECQGNPVRLDIDDLPALGQHSRLRLALPMTAPRAIFCALYLLEDEDAGGSLLAGQLRFLSHPTGADIRITFTGRIAVPMPTSLSVYQADDAARQLLKVIAKSIVRPPALADSTLTLAS